jgi:hypothetical protein
LSFPRDEKRHNEDHCRHFETERHPERGVHLSTQACHLRRIRTEYTNSNSAATTTALPPPALPSPPRYQFVNIHPFGDGNWTDVQNYPQRPTAIREATVQTSLLVTLRELNWKTHHTRGREIWSGTRFPEEEGISDILATTPAQSIRGAYDTWVRRTSRAILIDEAANMHRADLAWYVNTSSVLPYSSDQKMPNTVHSVWGNCLIPVFLGGDPRQLPPTVMTGAEQDAEGYLYNRVAEDGNDYNDDPGLG